MKLKSACLFIGLLFGLSLAANAAAIHTSTSPYGSPGTSGTDCSGGLCNTVTGVTILEQDYAYSNCGGQVYDFVVNTLPAGTTGYTLTLTGTDPFLNDTSDGGDGGQAFGLFVCPAEDPEWCDASDLSGSVSASIDSSTLSDPNTPVDAVTFTVSGDDPGIAFYAVVTQPDPVNAFLILNPTRAAVPEPRLWTVLGLFVVGLVLLRRRFVSAA